MDSAEGMLTADHTTTRLSPSSNRVVVTEENVLVLRRCYGVKGYDVCHLLPNGSEIREGVVKPM